METIEIDKCLMQACEKELRSLDPEDWVRTAELEYYIEQYKELINESVV